VKEIAVRQLHLVFVGRTMATGEFPLIDLGDYIHGAPGAS